LLSISQHISININKYINKFNNNIKQIIKFNEEINGIIEVAEQVANSSVHKNINVVSVF